MRSLFLSVAACLVLLCLPWPSLAEVAPGDRAGDVDATFPEALLVQNGGPVLDVTRPPEGVRAATGDGKTDDTDALQDAYDFLKNKFLEFGCFVPDSRYLVYLPNGTYVVHDTIFYRGPQAKWKGFDICRVRFMGQSRGKTVLQLVDRAPGFQDPAHPKALFAFQHPDTNFNNGPADSCVRNLTFDVGSGNPGAVGLTFQGANQLDLRNVTIVSRDGAGKYGLWCKIGSVQSYATDLTIDGFDVGIEDEVNPEGDPTFEYVTLRGQRTAAIRLSGGGMSLRKVLSEQAAANVPGLRIEGSGVQGVLLDSLFKGAGGPAIEVAQEEGECLFARNVAAEGYGPAVKRAGRDAVPGPQVDEYCTSPAKVLFDGQRAASLALPIEDAPPVDWGNPATDWAVVDDGAGLQAALDSGKPVVCLKRRSYKLGGKVTVPPSVRMIELMGADIDTTFVVAQPSDVPLLVQDGGARVSIEANRNFIGRCLARNVLNPRNLPVTFWLENANDCASGDLFCPPGAKVFARQIDVEYKNVPQIVCSGGTLWIMGFKTEAKGMTAPFTVKNGGVLEILGGYVNMLSAQPPPDRQFPLVTNLDSSASVTCFTNMVGLFVNGVKETRDGETRVAPSTDFPPRKNNYRTNYVVPLYVGAKS